MNSKPFTVGERAGMLTFIKPAGYLRSGKVMKPAGLWLCDCGKEIVVRNECIRSGNCRSCGCSRKNINITHGQTKGGQTTRAYVCWAGVVDRCNRQKNKSFHRYGGRKIGMYEPWRKSFQEFFDYMGPGKKGYSIERINNDGNYEPGNCVWATNVHQSRNRRSNLIYTLRGVTATLIELVEKFGGNYMLIRWRLKHGWDIEKAFFQPARKRRHKG